MLPGYATDIANAQNSLNEARSSIATANQDFNSNLATARTYVGYFNAAFMLLIALLALVILGIILILRNVKGACRTLGVVFFLSGALEFAGVLIIKNVGPALIARLNILPALSNVPGIVLNDIIAPMQSDQSGVFNWRDFNDWNLDCLSHCEPGEKYQKWINPTQKNRWLISKNPVLSMIV